MARRLLYTAVILCFMFDAAFAASNMSTAAAAKSGTKTIKSCATLDIGCATCAAGKGKGGAPGACLSCSVNGVIPAELTALGRCACPAGAARFGSPNTVNTPLIGAKVGSNSGGSAKAGKGAKGRVDVACAPCAEDAYATTARPVAISKCTVCPTGTTTDGDIGATTCFVDAGSFFNVATQAAEACPVDQWCPGGDIAAQGKQRIACPIKSTTQGQTGSDSKDDCVAAPGNYYDAGTDTVKECTQGFYCSGGSVTSAGQSIVKCPDGSSTASPGASTFSQCANPPGTFFDGTNVLTCPQGSYCLGGSVTGAGATVTNCPAGSATASAGSSSQGQCVVQSGSYWTGTAVAQCPANNYCAGGPISGNPQPTPCPTGTTSPAGSSSQGQCVVPPGSYWTGTAVAQCPANDYCAGGPVSSNPQPTPCPTGTTSPAGSSSQGQCAVPPGSYWTGTAVAQCPANNFCAGGPISGNPQPTPCPGVTTSPAGATSASQCTCNGAECAAGSVCVAYGLTSTPTCVCTATQIPVYTPTAGTCGVRYNGGSSVTQTYTVVPGQSYSLQYDSQEVPDRFVVVDGSPCGTVIADTGFTGQVDSSCPQTAPCCPAGSSPGCTGTPGAACPAFPGAIPAPGGGTGAGSIASITPSTNIVYVTSFGVCAGTGYSYQISC